MEHFGEPQISIAACNHSMEGGANHERRSLITAHHLDNNCCSEVWQKKHWASWHTTRKRREVLSACARAAGLLIASMCTPRSKHIQQHSEISFAIEYLTWQGKERQKLPRSKRREVHNLSINNTAHTRHTHTHADTLSAVPGFSCTFFNVHFNTQIRCTVVQIVPHLDLGQRGRAGGEADILRLSDGNVRICI